jgi:predicted ABC-type transport system involved in lysophospholipase L1 biosynthesis ATPase subunit
MTGGHPIIRLSGITKTYGQGQAAFQALKGIDLEVAQGEFIAVMGPSGSGKSTAMNIIGCLDTPSTGTYAFQGIRVETLTRDQRALLRRHLLGFVFQGFNLLARTSAIENVELPLIYRSAPSAARKAAARGRRSGWRAGSIIRRPNCPAGSSSASPSPAPSSRSRRCCSPTSRPAISIRGRAARSWN